MFEHTGLRCLIKTNLILILNNICPVEQVRGMWLQRAQKWYEGKRSWESWNDRVWR